MFATDPPGKDAGANGLRPASYGETKSRSILELAGRLISGPLCGTARHYTKGQSMPTLQEAQELAKRKLVPGEQLIDLVAGPVTGEAFNSIVALTTTRLRIITPSGGSSYEFPSIASISWAPAWARLNIDLKAPRKRLVLAVFGSEWKTRAKALADAAKPLIPK